MIITPELIGSIVGGAFACFIFGWAFSFTITFFKQLIERI